MKRYGDKAGWANQIIYSSDLSVFCKDNPKKGGVVIQHKPRKIKEVEPIEYELEEPSTCDKSTVEKEE